MSGSENSGDREGSRDLKHGNNWFYNSIISRIKNVFYTPIGFLFLFSCYIFFESLMSAGYTQSVITSIEQRYSLKSMEIGTIISGCNIGSLSVVVFVSWLGGSGNRIRWVASGGIIVTTGVLIMTIPQWISSPYIPAGSDESSKEICETNSTYDVENCGSDFENDGEDNGLYLFIFILGNIIIGIGSSPIYTLGITYINDCAPVRSAPVYVAIIYVTGAFGPALGYVVGGECLKYWVDPFVETDISRTDSRWVGRWWLGYLFGAVFIFLTALPLFCYGKNPPRKKVNQSATPSGELEEEERLLKKKSKNSQMSFGNSLTDLPNVMLKMVKNKRFLLVTVTECCEFSVVVAFLTFMPKYLQDKFSIDPSISAAICGGILIPAAAVGILFGGWLIKRFNLSLVGCAKFSVIVAVISCCTFIPMFFLTCKSVPLAGITQPYPNTLQTQIPCNIDCTCGATYDPICIDDITYINPCLAGCTKYHNSTDLYHSDCLCSRVTSEKDEKIEKGACTENCVKTLVPFLVLAFLATMATASAQTPSIMITLNVVAEEERPIAMGVQYVILRVLAYIPVPIYFGAAIDGACIVWENYANSKCQNSRNGACAVYSPEIFTKIYLGLAVGIKVISLCLVSTLWRQLVHHEKKYVQKFPCTDLDNLELKKTKENRTDSSYN